MTLSSIQKISMNNEIKIHTFMNVKEDSITLFGFLSLDELGVFNLLISVSGVGPKLALGITNDLSPDKITLAIASEDIKTLTNCSGVGKKIAQRIIFELVDKVQGFGSTSSGGINISTDAHIPNERQDAIDGLVALGYSRSDSMKTVMQVAEPSMRADQIIKLSLKKLLKK